MSYPNPNQLPPYPQQIPGQRQDQNQSQSQNYIDPRYFQHQHQHGHQGQPQPQPQGSGSGSRSYGVPLNANPYQRYPSPSPQNSSHYNTHDQRLPPPHQYPIQNPGPYLNLPVDQQAGYSSPQGQGYPQSYHSRDQRQYSQSYTGHLPPASQVQTLPSQTPLGFHGQYIHQPQPHAQSQPGYPLSPNPSLGRPVHPYTPDHLASRPSSGPYASPSSLPLPHSLVPKFESPATIPPAAPAPILPAAPAPVLEPAPVPVPGLDVATGTGSRMPKITLRVKQSTVNTPPPNMPSKKSHNTYNMTRSRPVRSSRASANYNEGPGSEEEEEEEEPQTTQEAYAGDDADADADGDEDGDGDGDYGGYPQPPTTSTRSGRGVKEPVRFDPAAQSLSRSRNTRRTSGSHAGYVDPQQLDTRTTSRKAVSSAPAAAATTDPALSNLFDDDEDNGPPPLPDTQETIGETSTPRKAANGRRGRSRQSSEGSFNPDDSDDHSDVEEISESDDPIAVDGIHGHRDSDDDSEAYESEPRRRNTRNNRGGQGSRSRQRQQQAQAQARKPTRSSLRTRNTRAEDEEEDDAPYGKKLRARKDKVNYALPPADLSAEILQDAIATASRPNGRAGVGRAGGVRFGGVSAGGGAGGKGLPWSARGRDLAHAMGDPDTSDSDDLMPAMKGNAGAGPSAIPAGGAGKSAPTDVQNFGRINPKSSTADADPLGVDMNVTFDNVGGLDGHINQLKEMVALPLLYPELFQQFGITPPRGVLFHGPPGTGKTLLARALAASCSTGNTKIAFFMRKGADVLSKWVGEAERQLRMLFDEARAAQPSIIFFDEIDGLAPVRSSKQDQIHASLVSTLLALMDGMDGRGQVIVIGATNRPDAVDPALRRPGRFDREFYFPLPNKEARKKIIGINTRKWDPKLSEPVLDQLAGLTKGYGGADLRALCTEAALNAIQRRYPQIYKTSDRLLLKPDSIQVQAKDFMMSVKKIVPSSARSSASAAAPIPPHLMPLLSNSLERLKAVVDHALPSKKNVTALEEAEYEEEDGDSFAKHSMLQSLDKMRTYRPRILVHGPPGMGQAWLGPAILHHLEGFHVQTLDLGTLMGDSSRTVESALVQLFVEAKRHQPSVIFIPSLSQWSSAISDTARSTIRALLDGIPSSDPILVLALVDGSLGDLAPEIRAWFGLGRENRLTLETPTSAERTVYFKDIIKTLSMPPTEFPDALPRKKRVLEILPAAPPLPPRQKTEAEIAKEHEMDVQAREMMIISFTGLIQDFMRKFRKVTATVREDAMELSAVLQAQQAEAAQIAEQALANGDDTITGDSTADIQMLNGNGHGDGSHISPYTESTLPIPPMSQDASQLSSAPPPSGHATDTANGTAIDPATNEATDVTGSATGAQASTSTLTSKPVWQAHDLDIDIVSLKLSKHKYLTPSDFLADISKIEANADKLGDPDRITRIGEMGAHARMHVMNFDPAWEPRFEAYAQRVRGRKAKRQEEKEERKRLEGAGQVEGANDSAGADAAAVTIIADDGTVTGAGGSLKRSREDGAVEDGESEREDKRMREDVEMDGSSVPIPTITLQTTSETAPSNLPAAGATATVQPISLETTGETSLPKPESEREHEATVPSPRVVHPPFILPTDLLGNLQYALNHATRGFTIEQLEQLRAACFDKIWRHRADWDRTTCVENIQRMVDDFTLEVDESRSPLPLQ